MKVIYLAAIFIGISFFTTAQITVTPQMQLPFSLTTDALENNYLPKAKLVGETELGKIYALSQDNMPCFVPTMPNAPQIPTLFTPLSRNTIPNASLKNKKIAHSFLFEKSKAVNKPASKNLMFDLIRKK
jgi:hypothetical protein